MDSTYPHEKWDFDVMRWSHHLSTHQPTQKINHNLFRAFVFCCFYDSLQKRRAKCRIVVSGRQDEHRPELCEQNNRQCFRYFNEMQENVSNKRALSFLPRTKQLARAFFEQFSIKKFLWSDVNYAYVSFA